MFKNHFYDEAKKIVIHINTYLVKLQWRLIENVQTYDFIWVNVLLKCINLRCGNPRKLTHYYDEIYIKH